MQLLKDLFHLFFPELCLTCRNQLLKNELIICITCRHDLPLTNFTEIEENNLEKQLYGRIPFTAATSLFYFHKKGRVQQLIHALKYKRHQEVGAFLGGWLGLILQESNRFSDIDIIIPVPVHPRKRKERGYNQLTTFGKSLSNKLNIPFIENQLLKIDTTDTQTQKSRIDRWDNVQDHFNCVDPNFFKDKHVLLIDDVVTTGATLEACSNQILKGENASISIAVMAFTE